MSEVFEKYNGENSETRAVNYLQSKVNNYYNRVSHN